MPELDDFDLQERSGLIGVWVTPESEGQEPVVSLEMVSGSKRYLRIWLRKPDHVDWGWVLSDTSVCVWRDPDEPSVASRSGEQPPPSRPGESRLGGGTSAREMKASWRARYEQLSDEFRQRLDSGDKTASRWFRAESDRLWDETMAAIEGDVGGS